MADIIWVKITSWHALRRDNSRSTFCGLEVAEQDPISDELPAEKSCENCLRIVARKEDIAKARQPA